MARKLVLLASMFLLASSCGGTTEVTTSKGTVWTTLDLSEPAALAERHQGKSCALADENLSGRGDEQACGPFPCDAGKCVVSRCDADASCHPGFCVRGYCVRATEQGSKTCAPGPIDESSTAALLERSGCSCVPQSGSRPRDRERCALFPCSPDGCYVKPCSKDEDCAFGLCSSHASGPHGYCVTDDPI